MDFKERMKLFQDCIDIYMGNLITGQDKYINTVIEAMRYSLFAGGKRLRPILALGVSEMLGGSRDDVLPYGAAIEMIHTYSLIHDDLPAMDNDDYRRGKLTNHKVFGEGMAVLAGDALLNYAFEHMLCHAYSKKDMKYVRAALEIAGSAGIHGMIGGQVVDLESEGKEVGIELIQYMHNNKTGALIKASVRAGAIVSDASPEDLDILTQYAVNLGLAFQIIDDILDIIGDEKKLGKKTGSDLKNNKATYVKIVGMDKAKETAKDLTNKALDLVRGYGSKADFLCQLTNHLLGRQY